jgi:hypothetical protein
LIPRFLIALPAVALLGGLGYRSVVTQPPGPVDRIASGLAHEREGRLADAERDLLAAADWDHLYEPRWTLAGFYFRRGRPDDFWIWTRQALAVGTHDLGGLFDLCWQVSGDRAAVWRHAMPDRKEIWNEYLAYLLASNRWSAASDAAARLGPRSAVEDLPMLLGFCDLAIERKDPAAALPVWNSLCRRGLANSTPIGRGHYLVNGDLARRPLGRGFDWRFPPARGIRAEWTPGELHAAFSGSQADGVDAIVQALALEPGRRYRFTYTYRTQGIAAGNLLWRVSIDGAPLASGASVSSDAEKHGVLEFSSAPTGGGATLALTCERACAGTVLLREMDIVPE